MKPLHLDDKSIQEYVFAPENCDKEVVNHINSCAHCREIAAAYKTLASSLKEQEKPILNAVLEDKIMQLIMDQTSQKRPAAVYSLFGPLIVMALGLMALMISVLISDVNSFVTTERFSLYVIMGVGLCTTILLAIDTIKRHQYNMNEINIS